jgi:hypothetical protein
MLPEYMIAALRAAKMPVSAGARGMIYNASVADLIRMLSLVRTYALQGEIRDQRSEVRDQMAEVGDQGADVDLASDPRPLTADRNGRTDLRPLTSAPQEAPP